MPKMRFLKSLKIFVVTLFMAIFVVSCASFSSHSGLANPNGSKTYLSFYGSIWSALGSRFSLSDETPENPQVREQINWYLSHPKYLYHVASQAQPYLYYISRQVERRGLPGELALLPMIESAYNPFAYSRVGAAGLWQMMPGTASGYGVKVDWWYDGRRDIIASTNSALNYLTYLANNYNGDWLLALAAYDGGEGIVNNAIQRNLREGKPTDFWHLPLPAETKSYVPKLLALATIIKHNYEYPVDWPNVPNSPYLAEVDVGSQIDLARAAKMAKMSLHQLALLNPGFNRWATDPDGPFTLLLPVDKAEIFQEALSELPEYERVTWIRHVVQANDTLSMIAFKYKTTVKLLREINHLKNDNLKLGQSLLIPKSTDKLTALVLHADHYQMKPIASIPEIKITTHTVKKGDTLESISKKYRVTPNQIRFWNGMRLGAPLSIGRDLIIWPPRHHTVAPKKTVTHSQSKNQKIVYHVKSGDTLVSIAEQYHVSTKDLTRFNHITNVHHLLAGQTLVIYT